MLYWSVGVAFLGVRIAAMLFVFAAGVIQGRTTGTYPTVVEWSTALRQATFDGGRVARRRGRHERDRQ